MTRYTKTRTERWSARAGATLAVLCLGAGCYYTPIQLSGHISYGRLSKSTILRNARRSRRHANEALYGIVMTQKHPNRCDPDLMRRLLALGASPFYKATWYDRTVDLLLKRCPPTSWGPFLKATPSLARRAHRNMYELASVARLRGPKRANAIQGIKTLLASGADANYRDPQSGCPLLVQALHGCTLYQGKYHNCRYIDRGLIAALLKHGAKVNVWCTKHRAYTTPLHQAAAALRPDLVRMLLNAGARPNRRDRRGATAMNKALQATQYLPPTMRQGLRQRRNAVIQILQMRGATATGRRTMGQYQDRFAYDRFIQGLYRTYCVKNRTCADWSPKCWHSFCRDYSTFRGRILRQGGWFFVSYSDKAFHAICAKGEGGCDRRVRKRRWEAWRRASNRYWAQRAKSRRHRVTRRASGVAQASGSSLGPAQRRCGVPRICWTMANAVPKCKLRRRSTPVRGKE